MRKPHLDFLALAARLLEGFGIGESARTWSRTSSSMSRETLRAFAVVHRGLSSHLLQSYMLAR
jgi:hypothetical protein